MQYKFNTSYPITKFTVSKSIGKIELMIKNLEYKYPSGLYRAKPGTETVFYQQKPDLESPSFFTSRSSPKKGSKSNLDVLL